MLGRTNRGLLHTIEFIKEALLVQRFTGELLKSLSLYFFFVHPLLGVMKKQLWQAHANSYSSTGSPTIVSTKRREVGVVRHRGWTKSLPVDKGKPV